MVKFWSFHLKRGALVSRGPPVSNSNSQCISMLSLSMPSIRYICDWACENRAYLHTNFASFFKLQTDVTLYLVILSQ